MNYFMRFTFLLLGFASLYLAGLHLTHEHQTIPDGMSLSTLEPQDLEMSESETRLDFAARLNSAVHDSTYHCLPEEFSLSWIERLTDRYLGALVNLQWSEGLVGDDMICGFCHQRSITLAKVMRDKGFDDAWSFGVIGHVVLKFSIDGRDYIADPDYGVDPFLLPSSTDEIFAAVHNAYSRFDNAGEIAGMFASVENNQSYHSPRSFQKIERNRAFFFVIANAIATLLIGTGAALIYCAFRPRVLDDLVGRIATAVRN